MKSWKILHEHFVEIECSIYQGKMNQSMTNS